MEKATIIRNIRQKLKINALIFSYETKFYHQFHYKWNKENLNKAMVIQLQVYYEIDAKTANSHSKREWKHRI